MNARVRPRKGEAILRLGRSDEAFGYTLAGRRFWTDQPLSCLGPPEARGRLPRRLSCSLSPPLELAAADPDRFEEQVLGPPILLLLAARAIWALHASAVFVRGNLFVFLGESGRGKSTLAALDYAEWERAADDLLPFELVGGDLVAHLDYPQLKLDPPRRRQAPAPVSALIALGGPGSAAAPQLSPLSSSETARLLLGQTVPARCYGPDLLAAHLEACASAAGVVPAYRLDLPRDLARLPEAAQLISDLARPAS